MWAVEKKCQVKVTLFTITLQSIHMDEVYSQICTGFTSTASRHASRRHCKEHSNTFYDVNETQKNLCKKPGKAPKEKKAENPPRSVSVSINGSGEIVEGESVTLICSSDSNPPALNFIWFKEDQSSAVGSGQSFSALQSGRFYCEAHNQHGSQRSDAVTVTVKGRLVILYISIGVVCGAAVIITMLIWGSRWMKKRNNAQAAQHGSKVCKSELNSHVYENIPRKKRRK
ncbi:hypothetical protein G5714_000188 [Onychostoma macrolepis]|uniref:Ig-like domain-containing protein n=1 Tax=Onychostoma macrolepis TaxID=369639 RepID=A0A7J6DFU1_9TELE|nr:hypothetical protein G5714_000188 [Onychostoma macrolepis]